jgi:GT2 family glycosyltransferase
METEIDILIPAINNSYFTCSLINSIKNHTKIPFKIIYIDNGSEVSEFNNVVTSLENIDHLIIRNDKNLGFVKAINQGLKLSQAKYICFQNNDTLVFNNCFERLIFHLNNNQDAGIVSPIASAGGGKQGIEIITSSLNYEESEINKIDIYRSSHTEVNDFLYKIFKRKALEINRSLAFFSVVMPRKTFEEIGYLDERYGIGLFDDDDYCQRIISKDLKLLLALDVYVWHLASTTFKSMHSNNEFMKMLIDNQKIFQDKWKSEK